MVTQPAEPAARFDAEDLDLASGLIFALDVCLSDIEVGEVLELTSTNPAVGHELPAWCRGDRPSARRDRAGRLGSDRSSGSSADPTGR